MAFTSKLSSFYGLLIILVHIVCSSGQAHTIYEIQAGKSLSNHMESIVYFDILVSHVTQCANECSKQYGCYAFFADPLLDSPSPGDKFSCQFMTERLRPITVPSGQGQLGVRLGFYYPDVPSMPVEITGSVFQFISLLPTEEGVLMYDCSRSNPNMTIIGFVFDGYDLPKLTEICGSTLCQQSGLSGTLVKIKRVFDKHGFINTISPVCPSYDSVGQTAICDTDGKWTYIGDSSADVGCITTTCYRHDSDGMIVYNGNQSIDSVSPCHWPHFV